LSVARKFARRSHHILRRPTKRPTGAA